MNEPVIFRFRCPSKLKVALEAKAAVEMISVSACVRRLLVRSLVADGMILRQPSPDLNRKAAA